MTTATKSAKQNPPNGMPGDGKLPIKGLRNPMTQPDITGKNILHATPPLEVMEAADFFLKKKVEMNSAKSNADKAAMSLLTAMNKHKLTLVIIEDDLKIKRRIGIRQGEEKLKVEKATD